MGLLKRGFGHPYWSRLAAGVQTFCSEQGMAFLLGDSRRNIEEEQRQFRILLESGVHGIVVLPCCVQSDIVARIRQHDLPVVALSAPRVRVPGDLGLVAYTDGVSLPEYVTSATCEPVEEVGHRAAEMLHERIHGYAGSPREQVLGYQAHYGQSSGKGSA